MNALQQLELDELEELTEESKQRFQITDLSSLNWTLRKLTALEVQRAEVQKLAQSERDRISVWEQNQFKSLDSSCNFFESLIEQYAREQIKTDPKWKGNKTPYGKVNFHKQKDLWEYDEKALVAYLEKERKTALLMVKKEPAKELIKDYYTLRNGVLVNESTGEVVPGVTVVKREPKLSIKLEG